jgi:hypothetical protein
MLRYLRWRLSAAGRATYRSYALTMDPQRTLTSAPARRARAASTGYARGWQDFERPQRGTRHRARPR